MDELKQIGEMIYSNVQWIFSGIGVAVISILGGKAAVKKVKRKQKAKNQGVNISWFFRNYPFFPFYIIGNIV